MSTQNTGSNSSQRTSYGASRNQTTGGGQQNKASVSNSKSGGSASTKKTDLPPTTHYAYTLNEDGTKDFVQGMFIREKGQYGTLSMKIPGIDKTVYVSKKKDAA